MLVKNTKKPLEETVVTSTSSKNTELLLEYAVLYPSQVEREVYFRLFMTTDYCYFLYASMERVASLLQMACLPMCGLPL